MRAPSVRIRKGETREICSLTHHGGAPGSRELTRVQEVAQAHPMIF
jgi:hypothetical protein